MARAKGSKNKKKTEVAVEEKQESVEKKHDFSVSDITSQYPVLIALSGPKFSGKTSLSQAVSEWTNVKEIVSFARPLKDMAKCFFGLNEEQVNGIQKETPFLRPITVQEKTLRTIVKRMYNDLESVRYVNNFNPYGIAINLLPRGTWNTPREAMQCLGTEIMQSICAEYSPLMAVLPRKNTNGLFLVDDMRFPLEDSIARENFHFYYSIRIIGRNERESDSHVSEHAWKNINFDYTVDSNCELEEFIRNGVAVINGIFSNINARINSGDVPKTSDVSVDGSTITVGKAVFSNVSLKPIIRW